MFARSLIGFAATAAVLAAGCHRTSDPEATGSASFSVVEPAPAVGSIRSDAQVSMETTRAQYREASLAARPVLPVYPARALAAKAGAARIGVRVTIDAKGRVTGVNPSMRTVSLAPPGFADDFRAAVEMAVGQWKFQSARIEYVETVSETGITFERLKRSDPQESELDLAFEFTAKGGVASGK
jgi:hypothetical protein